MCVSCGDGTNRWCDKSFSLVVFGSGHAGIHGEHTWADGPILAHAMEYICLAEYNANPYEPDGGLRDVADPATVKQLARPYRLDWLLSKDAEEAVLSSLQRAHEDIGDFQTRVFRFGDEEGEFGTKEIKRCGVSPDAFVQMALQLAYRRDAGSFCLTYESSQTRLFLEGRTETIRSLSNESVAWVNAMNDKGASKQQRKSLLDKATARHTLTSKLAMLGQGVDRHLFCLYVMARGLVVSEDQVAFLKNALAVPWTMSTSQIPQQQTSMKWPKGKPSPMYSCPGGGFGPVADTGYGVSYMLAGDDCIYFHVAAKRSAKQTDPEAFRRQLCGALKEIRDLCQP